MPDDNPTLRSEFYRFLHFWLDVFSEQVPGDDHKGSWARVGSAIALTACIVWDSYIVYHTKVIPSLEGQTFFVMSFYTMGKLLGSITMMKGAGTPQNGEK